MAMHNTANEAWIDTLETIMEFGVEATPRDMVTKELLDRSVSFHMEHPVCFHQNRKLSYRFMAAEALWITDGSNSVTDIAPYNRNIEAFSDNGQIFNGAYGPHFNEQFAYVCQTLLQDADTRQAVMTLWTRKPTSSKDIACTVAMAWNVRDGSLNCHVFMRSSDAWLGLPYDMFNFTVMTIKILCELNKFARNLTLGRQYMTLVSSHLYEKDYLGAADVTGYPPDSRLTDRVPSSLYNDWDTTREELIMARDNSASRDTPRGWYIRP